MGNGKEKSSRGNLKRRTKVIDFQSLRETLKDGFPDSVALSFKHYVSEVHEKSIVFCRVPGELATQLIDLGYDTKGFQIKAKSCDWGPMAGFICKFPLFNKEGLNKAEFNLKELSIYLDKRLKKNDYPFIPLRIPDDRFEWLKEKDKITTYNIDDNTHYFVCCKGEVEENKSDNTTGIISEFLLRRSLIDEKSPGGEIEKTTHWEVYHGGSLIKENESDQWSPYQPSNFAKRIDSRELEIDEGQNILSHLSQLYSDVDNYETKISKNIKRERFKSIELKEDAKVKIRNSDVWIYINENIPESARIVFRNRLFNSSTFYPLMTAANPHERPAKRWYKDIVTGDYDLFSVIPLDLFNEVDLMRLTEKRIQRPFTNSKILTIKFTSSFGLDSWIELIPHYKEMDDRKLESETEGNYNNLVEHTWGRLNELIKKESGVAPKRVHHSDEGGRPSVNILDLPVAAFFPWGIYRELRKNSNTLAQSSQVLYISTPFDYLNCLISLQESYISRRKDKEGENPNRDVYKHILPLNYGWFVHLYSITLSDKEWESLEQKDGIDSKKLVKYKAKVFDSIGIKKGDESSNDVRSEDKLSQYREDVFHGLFYDLYVLKNENGNESHIQKYEELIYNVFLKLLKYSMDGDMSVVDICLDINEIRIKHDRKVNAKEYDKESMGYK